MDGDENFNSASVCSGTDCTNTPEGLLLAIGNANPIALIVGENQFDVSGFCDSAGYPGTRLDWSITGTAPMGPGSVENACDELGRFRLLLTTPQAARPSRHTLTLSLKGITAQGVEVENPLGLNTRRVDIDLR